MGKDWEACIMEMMWAALALRQGWLRTRLRVMNEWSQINASPHAEGALRFGPSTGAAPSPGTYIYAAYNMPPRMRDHLISYAAQRILEQVAVGDAGTSRKIFPQRLADIAVYIMTDQPEGVRVHGRRTIARARPDEVPAIATCMAAKRAVGCFSNNIMMFSNNIMIIRHSQAQTLLENPPALVPHCAWATVYKFSRQLSEHGQLPLSPRRG